MQGLGFVVIARIRKIGGKFQALTFCYFWVKTKVKKKSLNKYYFGEKKHHSSYDISTVFNC
jgi:hypothetical protein